MFDISIFLPASRELIEKLNAEPQVFLDILNDQSCLKAFRACNEKLNKLFILFLIPVFYKT